MRILLIEDNDVIVEGLLYAFSKKEYECVRASGIKEAKRHLSLCQPDLIVLDIGLPDGNGFTFYSQELVKMPVPVIFLTAEDDEETIVKSLNLGADDYVTKPFSTKELLARINRVLMRNKKESVIRAGGVSFDMDSMTVTKEGKEVMLTGLERKLLHLLFLNRNQVVTRAILLDKIWEWTGNDVDDHTVTVYMKRIREKVGNEVIITVKGIGYRVDCHEK